MASRDADVSDSPSKPCSGLVVAGGARCTASILFCLFPGHYPDLGLDPASGEERWASGMHSQGLLASSPLLSGTPKGSRGPYASNWGTRPRAGEEERAGKVRRRCCCTRHLLVFSVPQVRGGQDDVLRLGGGQERGRGNA